MKSTEYQQLASRTESTDFPTIAKRLSDERTIRLLHGSLGIQTEGGEIADALKKHVFYGTPLDIVNIAEEVGDCLWYLAIFSNEIGIDFPTIMENNIAKLKARYGEKFSEDRAVNRDLKTERKILEKNTTICPGCTHPIDRHTDEGCLDRVVDAAGDVDWCECINKEKDFRVRSF